MAKTFEEVTEKIRENLLDQFDQLKELKEKDNLSDNDLDYYLARDRNAAIVLKTLQMDIQKKYLEIRTGNAKTKKQITE